MQQLIIETNNQGKVWTRSSLEEYIRTQLGPNKELARYLVDQCNLEDAFFYSTPYIILLHWFLDLIIDTAKKTKNIDIDKICKIGLFSPRKTDNDKYKIAGWDPTNYDKNIPALDIFTKKLAKFINEKDAIFPTDYEGIDTERLKRYCNGEVIVDVTKEKKTKRGGDIDIQVIEELKQRISNLEVKLTTLEAIVINK
jgi:hypothetical protein